MSIAQYANRTVDVTAYHGSALGGDHLLTQQLVPEGQSGSINTGVVKLAQKFLLKLFKERGSKLYSPSEGNDFMTEAKLGQLRTQIDVFMSFASALVDIRREFVAEETADTPDDERYGDARLLAVSVAPGSVNLTFQITSIAGESAQFIAPLPVTVGG